MAFDWIEFFNGNSVQYSDRGNNVSKNHVVIRCPWCGSQDEGQHLSVNLIGKGYRCFRNPQHRGKSPVALIAKITGLSFENAAAIAGSRISIPTDFMERVKGFLTPTPEKDSSRRIFLPPEFRKFDGLPAERPFVNYLVNKRGIAPKKVESFTKKFGLRYCKRGIFNNRIIFPIVHDGKLISWTGRHISPDAGLRYLTLTPNEELAKERGQPQALGPITDHLLWYDKLADVDADCLCISEGPFDAAKVWYHGEREGIVGTAVFTLNMSEAQVDLLHEVAPKFKHRFLLLDRSTTHVAIQLQAKLRGLGFQLRQLPKRYKDPGELDGPDPLVDLIVRRG